MINFKQIISDLNLEENDQIKSNQVFDILFKSTTKDKSFFYANYLLLQIYSPYLEKLKRNNDINDDTYDSKNNEIDAFFTLWYGWKGKKYPSEQKYALVVSPFTIYTQSKCTINGYLQTNNTLEINLVSANLLRQTIELLLLEACNYPLKQNNRSPSFSKIIDKLKINKYTANLGINDNVKIFLPTNYPCLDILNDFYQYLSRLLHKNTSGYLFSWQLHFIQETISGAFLECIPRIKIITPELTTNSKFYSDLECKPNI